MTAPGARKCRTPDCPNVLPAHQGRGRPPVICRECSYRARLDRNNRRARDKRARAAEERAAAGVVKLTLTRDQAVAIADYLHDVNAYHGTSDPYAFTLLDVLAQQGVTPSGARKAR